MDGPGSWLQRLEDLGLRLPAVPAPVAAYVPAVLHGGLIWVSGQLPVIGGQLQYHGQLGAGVALEEAYAAARLCALNALAAASSVAPAGPAGVGAPVSVEGFVQCVPDFRDQAKVINGASELFGQLFPGGGHRRFAVGCAALPLGSPVEVGVLFSLAAGGGDG